MQQAISIQLNEKILQTITQSGLISFAKFMQMALYEPGLGYYSNGSAKFGPDGDFTTAPELSPLFGHCLGYQCLEILNHLTTQPSSILELGAGSGKLASNILHFLTKHNALPNKYYILEVSADLINKQQTYLRTHNPEYFKHIVWLDTLPATFTGVILANEVMDAIPVHKFKILQPNHFLEYVVGKTSTNHCTFVLQEIAPSPLYNALEALQQDLEPNYLTDYSSEISLLIPELIKALSSSLTCGAIFIIDYGFSRTQYYHPSRDTGTLMCHHKHRAHTDPLINLGLQDITAHVDFSQIAQVASACGLNIDGYTEQSAFLLANDLLTLAQGSASNQYDIAKQIQTLTMPHEMGELFKVISLSRGLNFIPRGFNLNNKKYTL